MRLSLLEADKQIGQQQEIVYQRRTEIQTDEQKCDFFRERLGSIGTERRWKPALRFCSSKNAPRRSSRKSMSSKKAEESFIQLVAV